MSSFPCGSDGKDSTCSAGDLGLIPELGRFPGTATHSSILAWEIPWTEELGRQQSMESLKSWMQLSDFISLHTLMTSTFTFLALDFIYNCQRGVSSQT